jgi:hypothetical protein
MAAPYMLGPVSVHPLLCFSNHQSHLLPMPLCQ